MTAHSPLAQETPKDRTTPMDSAPERRWPNHLNMKCIIEDLVRLGKGLESLDLEKIIKEEA